MRTNDGRRKPFYKRKNPSVADLSALVKSVVGGANCEVPEVVKEEDSDEGELELDGDEEADGGREKEAPR